MKKRFEQPGPFALPPLRGFVATTSRSVPTQRIGTLPLAGVCGLRFFLGIAVLVPTFRADA